MKMIELAKNYIGTIEGSAKHKEIIDGYNQIRPLPRSYPLKYTDAWCAGFVSFLAWKCGVTSFPFECGVGKMLAKARANGQETKIPKIGDCIIYDWGNNGTCDHVGIIYDIDDNCYTVIEGNYSNSVKVRKIPKNHKEIEAFFKTGEKQTTETSQKPAEAPQTLTETQLLQIAKDVITGKYGNGEARRKALGNNYSIVQKKVNELLKK